MPLDDSRYKDLYDKLNPEQKAAVDEIDGPVLVVAGPGTGKTQVLSMRIANILQKTDVPPDAILALTFTESGVRAMRDRLFSIIGKEAYYINIHTFHSFASDIIRSNPDEFIISTQIEPLADLERIHIFKEIIDEHEIKSIKPFNAPYYYIQAVIEKIKDLKREAVTPEDFLEYIKTSNLDEKELQKNLDLYLVYKSYQAKLTIYKRYDFEDMINFVIDRFKTSPDFLSKYQERFQYFLVDEFQDTNTAQAELLYLMNSFEEFKDNPNLFVVGDDDQSIYRFQGASIENILNFYDRFPKSKVVVLKSNYRSCIPIVEASSAVIKNNKLRISNRIKIDKQQISDKKSDELIIKRAEFFSYMSENHYIASEIKHLIDNKGVKPSEIAIIYRNNSDANEIKMMLGKMDIKYRIVGGENILNEGIVIRLLHLFRVIYKIRNVDEDLDLFTLLNYEFLDNDALDILKLSRFASQKKVNLFTALRHNDINSAGIVSLSKLTEFLDKIIEWNQLSANKTFIDFFEDVLHESGYINWILSLPESYVYLHKINSFISEVSRLNRSDRNLNLGGFLHYLDLMYENRIAINEEMISPNSDAVNLLTAHKSKGLEYECVFIPQCVDKKWSNGISRELIKLPENILKSAQTLSVEEKKSQQEEDERRLFFVVLTRAKDHLYITSSKNYQSSKVHSPCMFINELPESLALIFDSEDYEKNNEEILKQILKPMVANSEHSEEEKLFLRDAIRDFKLSASSLNTYLECPYRFKLQFLFRTPKAKTKSLILGSAVHKALEESYKQLKDKIPVDFEYLYGWFEKALEVEILNDSERDDIKSEGKSVLKIYYQTYETNFQNPSDNFIHLEKFFGWGWSKPMLENVHLQGKVDKIEVVDPKKRLIRITDYKTGNPKSRNEILGKTQYSKGDEYRQLLFYKLMVELDTSFKYKVQEIELDFIGNRKSKPKKEVFVVSDEDIDAFKKVVLDSHLKIKELKFDRTSDYSACGNCDFKHHCWPDGVPSHHVEQLSLQV